MNLRTAVVLAAGEGTRLRPLTRNRPKPMLPAANRPILEHVLDALVDAGIEKLVLVVGYRRERVQNYVGPTYRDVPVEYVIQDKQLGSGHALLQAREAVSEPLVVVNGDRLIEAGSVQEVAERFERGDRAAAMAVIEREDPSRYGVVELDGDRVVDLVEKPETSDTRLINAGIYAFGDSIFAEIEETPRESGELAITETIARLVDRRELSGVTIEGSWVDATYPWDLLSVASEVFARGETSEPEREAGVWIDADAIVHDDATLQAPVVVGPDCEISAGAVIGPNVALARNVTVGANATIDRAVVDEDSRIGPGATLVDAVLGQAVHLGAGSVIPGGPGDVRVGTRIHEDRALGAVLADRVRVGGAATFAPGTVVGAKSRIAPGCRVGGRIAEGTEVGR